MTPTLPALLPDLSAFVSLITLSPFVALAIPFVALGLLVVALAWAMRP